MWTCPKCGRDFKNENQSHYCGKKPETVEEYIAAQPEKSQHYLKEIREVIGRALPEAKEKISWSMPTYWNKHNIIHFAAHKNHVGLYAGTEAVIEFGGRLEGYKPSEGAIRFPYDKDLPLDLIGEIARWA